MNTTPFRGSDGKYHFLYITKNVINGKEYFGKHTDKSLNTNYIGSGTVLRDAVKKYGKENFKRTIVAFYESKELVKAAEKLWITDDIVKSQQHYNVVRGGTGGDSRNFYKTFTPKQIAEKAAATLRSKNDTLLERNRKVGLKAKKRFEKDPAPFLERAALMNAKMKNTTKENNPAIRKQVENRKRNHVLKMKMLFETFKELFETHTDIRACSDLAGISLSTGYRFAKQLKSKHS